MAATTTTATEDSSSSSSTQINILPPTRPHLKYTLFDLNVAMEDFKRKCITLTSLNNLREDPDLVGFYGFIMDDNNPSFDQQFEDALRQQVASLQKLETIIQERILYQRQFNTYIAYVAQSGVFE